MKISFKILVGKLERKRLLRSSKLGGRIVIKWEVGWEKMN
jgi:hypothetical protein